MRFAISVARSKQMLLTKLRCCKVCPDAYCYLCPRKPALLGYRHRLYLAHELIERFKNDFASYKTRGYLKECDIDMISTGDYASIRLTSVEKYHRLSMEVLFPYCHDFELNERVIQ